MSRGASKLFRSYWHPGRRPDCLRSVRAGIARNSEGRKNRYLGHDPFAYCRSVANAV